MGCSDHSVILDEEGRRSRGYIAPKDLNLYCSYGESGRIRIFSYRRSLLAENQVEDTRHRLHRSRRKSQLRFALGRYLYLTGKEYNISLIFCTAYILWPIKKIRILLNSKDINRKIDVRSETRSNMKTKSYIYDLIMNFFTYLSKYRIRL